MKKQGIILLIALLLTAALLGWQLPTAVFDRIDRAGEGKAEPVSLRKVDLSYQSDLQVADRMRLIANYPMATSAPLERGVYLDAVKAEEILAAFLQTLTGTEFTTGELCVEAEPLLLSFPEEGAFLVWALHTATDAGWYCEAVLDDQTGLILGIYLGCERMQWEDLIPDLGSAASSEFFLYARLETAMRSHFQTQLSEAFTSSWEKSPNDADGGEIVLYRDGREEYRISFVLIFDHGFLRLGL